MFDLEIDLSKLEELEQKLDYMKLDNNEVFLTKKK